MFYLNVEHVLFIHSVIDEVFEEYSEPGELRGLRDPYLLESAVMQPRQTFDGVEIYPGLFDKAGVLLYGLTKNHPFVNGNKRTAFLSTSVFLLLNGYAVRLSKHIHAGRNPIKKAQHPSGHRAFTTTFASLL